MTWSDGTPGEPTQPGTPEPSPPPYTPPPPPPPQDVPPAPGYWKASDGQWYPPQQASPQQHAGPQYGAPQYGTPPAQTPQKSNGCLKAFLIVFAILVVLGILGAVAAAVLINKAGDELEKVAENLDVPATVDPNRPDAQKEDQQADVGEAVELSGYTTTVASAEFQASLSEFEDAGYLVLDVTVENRDNESQPYNVFDWRLQTPSGEVVSPTIHSLDDSLGSGDLIGGGATSGKVVFEIGADKGEFFVIYKPDPFDAARGVWRVEI